MMHNSKNRSVPFSKLQIGDVFSLNENPFIPCIKKNSLKYLIEDTNEIKEFYHDDTMIFVKK